MSKKIVIVGAGPSGLLLAHYLLARDTEYQIDIYERRRDPRTVSISKSRTFPIALNDRGMSALNQIPNLKEAVRAISVEIWGTVIHGSQGKQRVITRAKPLITLDRTELTKVLLNTLDHKYDHTRLNFHFQHSCTHVDLTTKQASFSCPDSTETESIVAYDLIVGADGARSVVRKSFLDTKLFELEQKFIDNDYKSIFLPSGVNRESNIALESDRIHT